MKTIIFAVIISFTSIASAGTLGTRAQKSAFVANAVKRLIEIKSPNLKFVENSVNISECRDLLNRAGEKISDLLASGVGDCDLVHFRVLDAKGRTFVGEMTLNSEHTKRKTFGLLKEKSMIPSLAPYFETAKDRKTNKEFYIGIFTNNQSKNQADMNASELFSLKPAPSGGGAKSKAAQ